ncbi:MAG: lytic murein transglycosylase [Candidatus Moraniibacteriota bacterium]|nr:MAG: lytic murein transglycosylase [Candidatus Moranbacteria bacterium]
MNQILFRGRLRRTIFSVVSLVSLLSNAALPFVAVAQDDVEDTQDDIRRVEKKIEAATKKKATLEQNLNQVNASLGVAIAAVRKTQAAILDTKDSITRAALEIELTDQQIALKQAVLADLVREAYLRGSDSPADIALGDATLSEMLDTSTQFATIGSRIGSILDDMERLKEDRETEKTALEAKKKESEEALAQKNAEKAVLAQNQSEIAQDVAEQTATIEELQKKLAELESDLNTLTGKSYNAKDIKEAVEFASDKTDVPKGVLYGFLKMETNLGANTGQCTYKEVEKVAVARYKKYGSKYKSSIALLYERQEIFYDLVDDLGYSKNKKVSCSPSGYIGQGGAMGVSQFMSDVWQGYSSSVASKTGHKIPDPWNLTDGVMAMALKLRKAGATSDKESVIKKASINYLGTFYSNYYNGIVYWSKNYKKLFD